MATVFVKDTVKEGKTRVVARRRPEDKKTDVKVDAKSKGIPLKEFIKSKTEPKKGKNGKSKKMKSKAKASKVEPKATKKALPVVPPMKSQEILVAKAATEVKIPAVEPVAVEAPVPVQAPVEAQVAVPPVVEEPSPVPSDPPVVVVPREIKEIGDGMTLQVVRKADVGVHDSDGKARPRGGQSGPALALEEAQLNEKERQVLSYLRSKPAGSKLTEIAEGTFASHTQDKSKANSWVRNSLRRLVRASLVRKEDRGTYRVAAPQTN